MTEKKAHPLLLPIALWFLVLFFIRFVIYHVHPIPFLWDFEVYHDTILSLRAGHDPYADGIAGQLFQHNHPETRLPFHTAFSYPYSPITVPLVRWIAGFPLGVTGKIYVFLCAIGIVLPIFVCLRFAHRSERRIAILLAPIALIFPGLIFNHVLFSGNIAYPIYALVMPMALIGWRRQRWLPFYLAVILASLVKGPLLVLLAIPVLCARRKWIPAIATGAVSCGIYALQPLIWPTLFRNYLTAVGLQFSLNRDLGPSPAGTIAHHFFEVIPFRLTLGVVYVAYAIPVAVLLLYLRRRFLAGHFSLRDWVPIVMLGVTLINPRCMEYDIAPITVLMGLAAWRIANHFFARTTALAVLFVAFVAANLQQIHYLSVWTMAGWRQCEGTVLLLLFFLGARVLMSRPQPATPPVSLALTPDASE